MLWSSLLLPLLAASVQARETLEEAGEFVLSFDSRSEPATYSSSLAVHTRELIAYRSYNVGTLISNYPQDAQSPVAGLPFGLVSLVHLSTSS